MLISDHGLLALLACKEIWGYMSFHCSLHWKKKTNNSRYLKISPLLINGDDEFVDVSNQLVAFGLPESISTLFKELHEHILTKEGGHGPERSIITKGQNSVSLQNAG